MLGLRWALCSIMFLLSFQGIFVFFKRQALPIIKLKSFAVDPTTSILFICLYRMVLCCFPTEQTNRCPKNVNFQLVVPATNHSGFPECPAPRAMNASKKHVVTTTIVFAFITKQSLRNADRD